MEIVGNIAYEKFNLIEVKSEDGTKNFYIEGHVSTIDPDSSNDIVTEQGQDDLVQEIKTKDITMDLDHESFRNEDGTTPDRDLNKIPIAKVTEVKRTALGTYVKAMLNKDHPLYKNILSSIKNGFLHSFSIAYHVKDFVSKIINGQSFRLLNKLELRNVGITGNPVNSNATFSISLKSHINKMEEENKKISILEKEMAEIKSFIEETKAKQDVEVKSKEDESKIQLETLTVENKSLKETIEAKDAEIVDLKSKLETPVNKAVNEQAKVKSDVQTKNTSREMMSYI